MFSMTLRMNENDSYPVNDDRCTEYELQRLTQSTVITERTKEPQTGATLRTGSVLGQLVAVLLYILMLLNIWFQRHISMVRQQAFPAGIEFSEYSYLLTRYTSSRLDLGQLMLAKGGPPPVKAADVDT